MWSSCLHCVLSLQIHFHVFPLISKGDKFSTPCLLLFVTDPFQKGSFKVLKEIFASIRESKVCPLRIDLVVALLFYVHGKHLRSCRDGQLT